MKTWILIMSFLGHAETTQLVYFPTEEACLKAKTTYSLEYKSYRKGIKPPMMVCVEGLK